MQVIFRGSMLNQFSLLYSVQSLNEVPPAPKYVHILDQYLNPPSPFPLQACIRI